MVQANIDNKPVSITLSSSQSTTVPTGETWKVTITAAAGAWVRINGDTVINDSDSETASTETVLTEGDTVADSYDSCHIGGWVVS